MLTRGITALALVLAAGSALAQIQGPSSSQTPYVLPATGPNAPAAGDVQTVSILTVGDSIGGYRMVGLPDGMGAFGNGDGTMTVLMTHEIGATQGGVRAHGQTGAFVSRWNINANASNLLVNSGRDHNTSSADAFEYDTATGAWSNAPSSAQRWNRFCSADLPAPSAYRFGNLGTDARLFMGGEEAGNEGRAYAHVVTGAATNQSWQLPHLGKFSWENALASPFAQQKTVVIGTDDSSPGQVYMYVGNKTDSGNDIERAGLTNGNLFGIKVNGLPTENRTAGASGTFTTFNHGDVANRTGASLQAESVTQGVTEFLRPEDGAWDTRAGFENNFYFVTTDRFANSSTDGRSRLYRMTFNDITNPEAGGSITMLLEGGLNGPQMMDNMCIDSLGRILIQEDPGSQNHLAKIWLYDTNSAGLALVADHDPSRFITGAQNFLTIDEEASGIFDAKDLLGDGWFIMNTQSHYNITGELVQGGQMLAMYVDPAVIPAPSALSLAALAGLFAGRRRR